MLARVRKLGRQDVRADRLPDQCAEGHDGPRHLRRQGDLPRLLRGTARNGRQGAAARAAGHGFPVSRSRKWPKCETCCGFGGTFSIKFGEISARLADNKCQNIANSGADAVVLGDLGCMLNIEGRLRRRGDTTTKVLHIAEVLAGEAGITHASRVDALQGARPRQAERRGAAAQPQEDSRPSSSRSAARRCVELDDFEGTREAARGDPAARARQPRHLARALRAQRRSRAAPRYCSRRRRRKSTRCCSRSPRSTR